MLAGFLVLGCGLVEFKRAPPTSPEEIKNTMEIVAASMDRKEIIKSIRHIHSRAQVCKNIIGTAFESKLKNLRKQQKNEE